VKPTPILFLGDSPDLQTGLGRISRDLAVRVSSLPEFRVGFLGRGGCGSSQLPFHQYTFDERWDWGEQHLERVWREFSKGDSGILMTIWDPVRLHWLVDPRPEAFDQQTFSFLRRPPFRRWGYFPVDATGPGDRLTGLAVAAVRGFNRRLAYTPWGASILSGSLGTEVDWLPHGYDPASFSPRERAPGRMTLGIHAHDILIGCVMTNQTRKDWGLAFAAVADLRSKIQNLRFWVHVDAMVRAWSIYALIQDFGLADVVRVTMSETKNDVELSYLYSACDLTILPSLGEGFGYPIVESLACGVPVIHGDYGGGACLLRNDDDLLVRPVSYRLDGPYNLLRPVFEPADWSACIQKVLAESSWRDPERAVGIVEHLQWPRLWEGCWKKWFLEGLK